MTVTGGGEATITAEAEGLTCSCTVQVELLGDVSLNNVVDVADAQLTLIAYVETMTGLASPLTEEQIHRADIDEDGRISVSDAQLILNYYTEAMIGLHPTWPRS